MDFSQSSDKAIIAELGRRIRQERLNQNIAQITLANGAGIARKVVQQIESGHGCRIDSLIRILRFLKKLDQLDALLPDPGISPVQLARMAGRERHRASGPRSRSGQENTIP